MGRGTRERVEIVLMKINLMSWNVRGLNNKDKRKVETKLEGNVREIIEEIRRSRWVRFVYLEASGTGYTHFETLLQDFESHITRVYAPICRYERENVWEEMAAARFLMGGPWLFDVKLIDPQLKGGSFTWFKEDNHMIVSRIDRILISEKGDDSFSNIKLLQRRRIDYDSMGLWEQNKSYFKFENWWLSTEGCGQKKKM
ncbi:hypothetical protein H5410_012907, partial [Solanum commersonii]